MTSEKGLLKTPEQRFALLVEAARAFAEVANEPKTFLDIVARKTGQVLGAYCSIAAEEAGWVRTVAVYAPDPSLEARLRAIVAQPMRRVEHPFALRLEQEGVTHLLFSPIPLEVLRARAPSLTEEELASLELKSVLLVAMRGRSETVGWLSLLRHGPDAKPFDEADVKLAKSLADLAALHVLNARMLAHHEQNARRSAALSDAGRAFAAATGEAELVALVVRRIGEIFDGLCILRRETTSGDDLAAEGVFHPDPHIAELARRAATSPMKRGEGLTGQVFASGTATILDLASSAADAMRAGPYGPFVAAANLTSCMFVPLSTRGRTVGVIAVGVSDDRKLSPADLAILNDLAAHVSVALMNCQLLAESRHTEEVLRRGFLDAAPDAVVIVDRDGKIIIANRQAETLFGFTRAELVGKSIELLVPDRFRLGHIGHRSRYVSTPAARPMGAGLELFASRKDGREFAAEIMLSPIETANGVLVAAAVRDVTERRREMDERNQRMADANRLKSEFLANMSHELRTPLNAIIGFASLMHAGKTGPMAPTHTEYLGDILTSAKHLLQLINDILDLAKIESGKLELRYERVRLEVVLAEVRDILRGLTVGRRAELQIELDPELGPVDVDPRMLKQVLYNYLSNAIKFSSPEAHIRTKIARCGHEEFRIDVEDHGPGIAPADLHRLFIEFQQLEAAPTKRHQGTGLGLALVKRIAEAHGGRVEVQSTPGKGSTFTAIFPRSRREPGP